MKKTSIKSWPELVLDEILAIGIRHFVLCAGSRNSSLAAEIISCKNIHHFHFFEERSAAFFALGLSRSLSAPVAIVTTSGTAVAELLPATIEAFYSSAPLLLLTADRPPQFRGTAAPQSIEQVGIFSHYVEGSRDWHKKIKKFSWSKKSPFHLNVSFEEEPYKEGQPKVRDVSKSNASKGLKQSPPKKSFEALQRFLDKSKTPLVILGTLPSYARKSVRDFLARTHLPIYAEATSGLRESVELSAQIIKSGEGFLKKAQFDGVLRIGGVPQCRFWRDLEKNKISVLNFDEKPFSGLARVCESFEFLLEGLSEWKLEGKSHTYSYLNLEDEKYYQKKLEILSRYPESEVGLFHRLSRHIPEKSTLFLGNSPPVREWDLGAHYKNKDFKVFASRGANGIDGQLSTFLGISENETGPQWGIFGDLTTLYDLSAPWVISQLSKKERYFVVINNRGGRIFSKISAIRKNFSDENRKKIVENEHELKFEAWAKMWNLGYERWSQILHLGVASSPSVIEITPNEEQSENFWEDYREIFR